MLTQLAPTASVSPPRRASGHLSARPFLPRANAAVGAAEHDASFTFWCSTFEQTRTRNHTTVTTDSIVSLLRSLNWEYSSFNRRFSFFYRQKSRMSSRTTTTEHPLVFEDALSRLRERAGGQRCD